MKNGVMEYWSNGVMVQIPMNFHYSNTPTPMSNVKPKVASDFSSDLELIARSYPHALQQRSFACLDG